VVDPRVPPAYVSDPEDHATGSYGHSLSALADLGTQEIQGTLAMGSPLTDSNRLLEFGMYASMRDALPAPFLI